MARSPASLGQELNQLRETLENAYFRQRTVEGRLRAVLADAGRAAIRVEVFDVVGGAPDRSTEPEPRKPAPSASIWPRRRRPGKALRPTPGLANLTMTDAGVPVVGMSVCGFGPEELDRIVAMVADKLVADQDFIPVFLTDSLHAEIFRKHRFAFEYFPLSGDDRRLRGTAAWSDYAAARLDLITRKYGLTRIVTFGKLSFCRG